MTTLTSPSPTLSPKPSLHGPTARRALSDIRRASPASSSRHRPLSSSHPLSSLSSSHHLSSSAGRGAKYVCNPRERTLAAPSSAPKPHTVDVGTQYSPPGFPPTARWPTSSVQAPLDPLHTAAATTPSKRREPSMEPPERNERVDAPPRSGSLPAASTIATASNPGQAASPSKRPRADNVRKVLPRNYADCDVTDLGVLISGMLMELVRINDKIPLRDGQLTRFHSRAPPAISVKDYLYRLILHATLSPPVLLSMVYYIDRMSSLYPGFTISSLTVHRFLIAAATVAAKGLSDSFWTNNTYARVGGVSAKELALLELFFLEKLDWKIVPQPEALVEYYQMLVERSDGYMFAPE